MLIKGAGFKMIGLSYRNKNYQVLLDLDGIREHLMCQLLVKQLTGRCLKQKKLNNKQKDEVKTPFVQLL